MPDFCANIDTLFTEYPFLERCRAAKEAGFSAVEFTLPADVGLGELGDAVAYKGLKPALLEMPEAEAAFAFLKAMKNEFLASFERLLHVADFIECRQVFIPGKFIEDDKFDSERDSFIQALSAAGKMAKKEGVKILIGSKNPTENQGFYPASTLEILEILDELNDDKTFGFLYDVYHAQMAEGGLSNTLESLAELITHIRIAGVPMREEPDVGEVNYGYLFSLLEAGGYTGQISCAYTPRLKTQDGLKWMQSYL